MPIIDARTKKRMTEAFRRLGILSDTAGAKLVELTDALFAEFPEIAALRRLRDNPSARMVWTVVASVGTMGLAVVVGRVIGQQLVRAAASATASAVTSVVLSPWVLALVALGIITYLLYRNRESIERSIREILDDILSAGLIDSLMAQHEIRRTFGGSGNAPATMVA